MRKLIILCLCLSLKSLAQEAKVVIKSETAPQPIGPYSQAIKANGMIYLAGQIGANPTDRKLVSGGIEAETRQALENIKAVLKAANASIDDAVTVTVYLKNMVDFSKMNEIYKTYFINKPPSRTTIGVADLPGGANIEISVVAVEVKKFKGKKM